MRLSTVFLTLAVICLSTAALSDASSPIKALQARSLVSDDHGAAAPATEHGTTTGDSHAAAGDSHAAAGGHAAAAGHGGHHAASIGSVVALVASLVLLSLFIEISTEHLEEFLRKKHVEEMLLKMYKELMILGVCSLFLFVEEKFDLMHFVSKEPFDKHLFELVHMMLFSVVVVYIVLVIYVLVYTIILANSFKKMEAIDDDAMAAIHEEYKVMKKDQKKMGTFISYAKFWWRWRYENVRFHRQFLQTREYFITQHLEHHEQMAEHFDFYVYLRKCIRTVCIQLAGVHWQVWLVVLMIVFIESALFQSGVSGSNSYIIMVVNCAVLWLTIVYMTVIWQKSIKCSDRICEKYDECCITNKELKKEAEKKKKSEQAEEDDEEAVLIEDDGKKKKKSKKSEKKKSKKETHEEHEDEAEEEEEEEEEEEIHGDTPEFHSGNTFFGVSSHHQKLFPFNSPSYVLRSIQFCVLLLAILLPLYGFQLWDSVEHAPEGARWFVHISMLLSPIVLCLVIVPNLLPRFVLAASVASMSRHALIKETIEKYEKEQRKLKRLQHKHE